MKLLNAQIQHFTNMITSAVYSINFISVDKHILERWVVSDYNVKMFSNISEFS